jgi:pSer/pThr/pTyr-binding forkhead associated (FHA) protein
MHTDAESRDAWLTRARSQMPEAGEYLAYEEDNEIKLVALTREWTRIGRSLAADIRFDDPTVSRRHALIVRQADGVRVLDDRSLNGVFVNGERVEWRALGDGDEVLVGRHRLVYLSDMLPTAHVLGGEELETTV